MAQLRSLEILGVVFLLILLFYIVKFVVNVVYTYVIGPAVNKVDFKSKGKWALITGCTDGIGEEYAKELAARGCDIVLVSRSMDKLKATATKIENDYKVNTKIIQADFSEGNSIYDRIGKEICDLEIGTLVNNVGVFIDPEYFLDIPDLEQTITSLIRTNMVSVTHMTALVLPGMVKRNKGVVINIGSASSITPSPLATPYGASKAYVEKFSEGIEMEYSKKGIIVQCVLPGIVCSKMSGVHKPTLFEPTAKTFVRSAIGLVGTTSKTIGYIPHIILINSFNTIHSISGRFAVWLITRSMEKRRIKAKK